MVVATTLLLTTLGGVVAPSAAGALVTSFEITAGPPADAQWGVPYAHTLTSDPPGATWSVVSGELPAGLTLDGASGAISGTSTGLGTYPSITVEATWDRTFTSVSGGATHSCRLLETGAVDCWGDNTWGKADDQPGPYTELSVGFDHTCALTPTGAVDCWGRNLEGQATDQAGPYTTLSTATSHTCALTPTGAADCWGFNNWGQASDQPGPYTQIATGTTNTCGLTPTGAADCWGWNDDGQATDQAGPFVALALGSFHTCGMTPAGGLDCWGLTSDGRAPDLPGPYSAITAGIGHTCALTVAGALECYGVNDEGQAASAPGPFAAIGAGEEHTCALRIEQTTTLCWGRDDAGQSTPPAGPPPVTEQATFDLTVGPPTITPPTLPTGTYGTSYNASLSSNPPGATWSVVSGTLPAGLFVMSDTGAVRGTPTTVGTSDPVTVEARWTSRFDELVGGNTHTCGLLETRAVQCWGANAYGQATDQAGPYTTITAGYGHTCGLTPAGAADCWGSNMTGQSVDQVGPYTDIAAGLGQTCAIRQSDGSADCWGENILGHGTDQPGPFTAIASGATHNCALTPAGAADCWGSNSHGQSADQVGPFTAIAAGSYHTCALTTTGDLDCWGSNAGNQAPPLQPGPFVAIATGDYHTCAVRTTGEAVCFGVNTYGQSADLPGPFTDIAAGDEHTCAVAPDGTATCWGRDQGGQSTAEAPTLSDQATFTVTVAPPAITSPPPTTLGWGAPSTHTFTAAVPSSSWTVADGSLPPGLTLDPTTGALLGAPTTLGTYGPVTVTASWGQQYASVDGGWQHSCALRETGAAECWGSGANGQAVGKPGPYTALSSGFAHSCALTPAGAADCWGAGPGQQSADQPGPYTVITSGLGHNCGLTPVGAADCWGDDTWGQAADQPGPFTAVVAGTGHTCGLTPAGAADCWGANTYGQATDHPGPFVALALGGSHTCALTTSGDLDCWGSNSYGQAVDQPGPFTAVTAGTDHTCALTPDGAAECTGADDLGQATDQPGPFAAIGAGDAHTCAIALGGWAVTCWGDDEDGQLDVPPPVDPPAAQSQVVTIEVTPPTITSPTPTGGSWNAPFLHAFAASAPGATWNVAAGSLPPGLTLDSATGTIAGTPGPPSPIGPVTVEASWPTLPDGPTQTFQLMTGPSISPVADQALVLGSPSPALPFTVSDEDDLPSNLVVTAASDDDALLPSGGLVLAGTGTWRSITVTPAPAATGSATVTLTVTDPGGSSVSTAFTVTVAPPAGSITGTVTDGGSGAPLGGIEVRRYQGTTLAAATLSAADGTYTFHGVAAGTDHRLAFDDVDGDHLDEFHLDQATLAAATPVVVDPGATTTVDASLATNPATISGTLSSVATGLPAGGVAVALIDAHPWDVLATTATRPDGTYEFHDVPPGTYRLRFSDLRGRFHRTWWATSHTYATGTDLVVTAGDTATADAALQPRVPGAIRGRTFDATGTTVVPGIVAQIYSTTDGFIGAMVTGTDGWYHLGDLPAGTYTVRFVDPTGSYKAQWFQLKSSGFNANSVAVTTTQASASALLQPS